jgi:hypothetical protein
LSKNADGTLSTDTLDANGSGDHVLAEWTPVASVTGTLIGSWGNNQSFAVYGEDGTLFAADTRQFVPAGALNLPGIEDGCYLLSGTTATGSYTTNFGATCAVNATLTGVDTTGEGFGNSSFSLVSFTITGDSSTLTVTFSNGITAQLPGTGMRIKPN